MFMKIFKVVKISGKNPDVVEKQEKNFIARKMLEKIRYIAFCGRNVREKICKCWKTVETVRKL